LRQAKRRSNSANLLTGAELDFVCVQVRDYYAAKLASYGATPRGVDWSCTTTQWLRFAQLLRICPTNAPFSLIDLGCGYGALATFLVKHRSAASVEYLGIDLSSDMVRRGRRRHADDCKVRFVVGRNVLEASDYVVASGIMNVMVGFSPLTWERFVSTILFDMHRMSKAGFAVNFLKKRGQQAQRGQLYCTTPGKWARFCEQELGRSIEILDDYGLQEFTLLARAANASSDATR
jgi:SAM-dependent methyltransferase